MSALRVGELFAGYGGLGRGVQSVLGGDIAWVSEIDPGACKILAHRFPDVPNHGDITAIDWAAVEPVDVLTGGFPCQDVSAAGKRAGIRPDTRSGLWSQFAYAINQLRPRLVVVENVRGLLSADAHHPAHSDLEPCPWCVGDGPQRPLRALGAVLGELADLGYDASWQGVRASDVGAPHGRFRVFVVAWPATDADPLGRWARWTGSGGTSRAHREPHRRSGAVDDDAQGDRRHEGWTESAREQRGFDAAFVGQSTDWGIYKHAIQRWEKLTRPVPPIAQRGTRGGWQLSPAFSEWMMGLPAGWVTDVPGLSRNEQLKALGNGVVPQQAAHALRLLLPDVASAAA